MFNIPYDMTQKKRCYISISSSSSSSANEDEYDHQTESDNSDDAYGELEQITSSSSSSSSPSDVIIDDDDDESDGEGESGEGSSDRVIRLLQDKSDLQELKLRDCKSYLRHHGLRITGTKTECIEKIMAHWRIKDGNAEALYPRSSFVVNCTGDVCRGDVVLFKQSAKKFNKKRTKQFRCIRTVAGQVVRESYGAGKQQHTFTIEVLWSKGGEQLPPLSYLLVKGRKLYRMKTFRQPWKNESERHKVLAEKHERGDAARLIRAMNRVEKECSKNKGVKLPTPSKSGKKASAKRGNRRKTNKEKVKSNYHHQKAPRTNLKKRSKARAPESSTKGKNFTHPYENQSPIAQSYSYPYPPQTFHQPQMHPNIPFFPHHPLHNYDPICQSHPFPPRDFHQPELRPNHSQYPQNYQGPNAQSYLHPPQDFHEYQRHHNTKFHPHHPQNSHQALMQYHHQQRNADLVFPHYVGPPAMPVSQNRGLNYFYNHSNVFGP